MGAVETITRGLFVWSFTEIILHRRKQGTLLDHMLRKKNPHFNNLKWAAENTINMGWMVTTLQDNGDGGDGAAELS